MKKLRTTMYCCTFIFIMTQMAFAGLFGSNDDKCQNEKVAIELKYKYCYQDKVAAETELADLKKQYQNEKLLFENTIKDLKRKIENLNKKITDLKNKNDRDQKLAAKRIKELKNTILILKRKSSDREKDLLTDNQKLQKRYEKELSDLKAELDKANEEHRVAMDALRKKYESKISDLEENIKNLNQELASLKKLTNDQKNELDRLSAQQKELEKQLSKEIKLGQIRLKKFHDKLIINIDNKISFASGSAHLKGEVQSALTRIGEILASYPENKIMVEGHTDSDKIFGGQFKDNWELSTERALSVLRFILKNKKLDKSRFGVAGYGEFNPLVPNTSAKNKALNRRVDIVVIPRVPNK